MFGAGSVRRVGEEARRLGRRALFICTPSLRGSPHASSIRTCLGHLLAGEFTGVSPHVPVDAVDAALAATREHRADLVVALGGGSAIGLGKAIAHRQDGIPLIAIPTTYAGSEMTPVLGITDIALGEKRTVLDPGILPRVVLYDPEVTVDLPPSLTASTGINALAHCVEAVYSTSGNALVTLVALDGAGRIARALPRCVEDGTDLDARSTMLVAAFLAGFSSAHAGMALHHGLCHSLGGKSRLPHGILNAIMLPHVMRYNADAVPTALAEVALALGQPGEGGTELSLALRGATAVSDLVRRLGLPQRLRDVGVPQAGLEAVARDAFPRSAVKANPKPIASEAQLLEVLTQAW